MKRKTDRDKLIFHLVNGFTAKEIAEKMGLSRRTIESHIEVLRAAHEARNTVHLVATLFRKNLIK